MGYRVIAIDAGQGYRDDGGVARGQSIDGNNSNVCRVPREHACIGRSLNVQNGDVARNGETRSAFSIPK